MKRTVRQNSLPEYNVCSQIRNIDTSCIESELLFFVRLSEMEKHFLDCVFLCPCLSTCTCIFPNDHVPASTSLCSFVYLSVHQCPYEHISVCPCVSVYERVSICPCLSVPLPVCMYFRMSICHVFVCMSIYPYVRLSVCLSVSLYRSVCLSFCTCVFSTVVLSVRL